MRLTNVHVAMMPDNHRSAAILNALLVLSSPPIVDTHADATTADLIVTSDSHTASTKFGQLAIHHHHHTWRYHDSLDHGIFETAGFVYGWALTHAGNIHHGSVTSNDPKFGNSRFRFVTVGDAGIYLPNAFSAHIIASTVPDGAECYRSYKRSS